MDAGLLGNAALRARLATLGEAEALHPCLLFEGPAGIGKAATARWLAQRLNCEAEDRPCGRCWSCRQIGRGQHPDVLTVGLDPERTAPIISVEQARGIVAALVPRPAYARRRFVIIDPAEAMSEEAANALLKNLEEPPPDTGFILITAATSRLLPTIRSRSQRVRFAPIPSAELSAWLAARGVDAPEATAALGEGCPGRALALAGEGAAAWAADREALLAVIRGPLSEVFSWSEQLTRGERTDWLPRLERALDLLGELLREALQAWAARDTGAPEPARSWARSLDLAGLSRLSLALDRARRDLEGYVNGRLLAEALLCAVRAELGDEAS
jgi:DNA polymerase III delta' subunit